MKNQYSGQKTQIADLFLHSDLQILEASGGQQQILRRKEFQLLNFLANNLGRVISRYAIIDLIWEYGSFAGSNTLEVHLSSLRKKIQNLTSQVSIQTVRGVGYRLKCL